MVRFPKPCPNPLPVGGGRSEQRLGRFLGRIQLDLGGAQRAATAGIVQTGADVVADQQLRGAIFTRQDLTDACFTGAALGPSKKGAADFTNEPAAGSARGSSRAGTPGAGLGMGGHAHPRSVGARPQRARPDPALATLSDAGQRMLLADAPDPS